MRYAEQVTAAGGYGEGGQGIREGTSKERLYRVAPRAE
jgi:hypothetical protein